LTAYGSLEESLEFFSNDGRPLRASMTLALSQQKTLNSPLPDDWTWSASNAWHTPTHTSAGGVNRTGLGGKSRKGERLAVYCCGEQH
jgi:hypothetical protein